MNKAIKTFKNLYKAFRFCTALEIVLLTLGGAILGLFEILNMTAIIPFMLLITDPDSVIKGRILGFLYRFSGLESTKRFAILLAVLVIIVLAAKLLFNILIMIYERRILNRWRICISSKLFNVILYSNYEKIHRKDSSFFINILSNSVPNVIQNFLHNMILLMQTAVITVVLICFALLVSPTILTTSLLFGALMIFIFVRIKRNKMKQLGIESQSVSQKLMSALQMSIFGLKEAKIALKERYFTKLFLTKVNQVSNIDSSIQFVQNMPSIIIEFISLSTILVAFILSMLLYSNMQEAAVRISLLVFLSIRFVPLINKSVFAISMINSSFEPSRKILDLFDSLYQKKQQNNYENPSSISPLLFTRSINFDDVIFKYSLQQKKIAINKVTTAIFKGQHVGIVGASGAGKSSFINIILGFLTNYKGRFSIDDVSIRGEDKIISLRKITSFVDQHPFLLNDTYIANIAYGVDEGDVEIEKVISSLKNVGLFDHVRSSEKGLRTIIGENGKFLSGGQRQRLAIARALYRRSEILILDEASSALDMDSESELCSLLSALKGKITIITIAHRLSTLKSCDKLLYMENGQILTEGSFTELYNRNATFKRYVDYSNVNISNHVLAS
ncbi:MAG: ABC transporter ATP-binding protein [Rickettsiales bacterium]|nr:ABC transporter ATP-binding protein [Rickettsiales bacterium]